MLASGAFHSYRPAEGHGLAHDPLSSIVGPRPIGWISTLAAGSANLAPYSFFNLFNYRPPLIAFTSVGWKDSIQNVETTGEFVWNLVSRDLAEAMNASSIEVAADVDEFNIAGLTARASVSVKPPRVAEALVAFECVLTDLHRLRGADQRFVDTWLAVGEVVMVHIASELLIDGLYDTARARPILRGGGGSEYFQVDAASRFNMRRPQA